MTIEPIDKLTFLPPERTRRADGQGRAEDGDAAPEPRTALEKSVGRLLNSKMLAKVFIGNFAVRPWMPFRGTTRPRSGHNRGRSCSVSKSAHHKPNVSEKQPGSLAAWLRPRGPDSAMGKSST